MDSARPSKPRLLLFASGDFAFNLYWQSIMLYLLFYYTEALSLPVTTAAAIYTAASIWDGIANFVTGALIDRHPPRGGYARILMLGSIPLGLACVLTYVPPPVSGWKAIAFVAMGHLLFRTAYAGLNVPYLAMTARISSDSRDRAFVAGMRMLFGTIAWALVAWATVPVGTWLSGSKGAGAYLGAAIIFALLATAILLLVGRAYRGQAYVQQSEPTFVVTEVVSFLSNRAFVSLSLAMMAMIAAVTVLYKAVLYYFKYFLHDEAAGQSALAWMGLASGAAIPLWMLVQRRIGSRATWFAAATLCVAGLIAFSVMRIEQISAMQLFLVAMQASIVGLHFAFWAMLPNTIEFGERTTGLRVEGVVFGLASLLQRVAIGLATAALGTGFWASGYVANVEQSAATLSGMYWTIVLIPTGFFAVSCLFMLMNPLRHGAHRRIVEELEAEAASLPGIRGSTA